jgi:hypothetical protein
VTTDATVAAPAQPDQPSRAARPLAITILGGYSLVLGLITFIPQLYYVLFAINQQVFPIGPNVSNPLGQVWYWYILSGQQGGYTSVDTGTLAGGVLDAFMMGPLYLITGVGLLGLRRWVVLTGTITAAMILYAILYFFLLGILAPNASTADLITVVLSTVPYLLYPLLVIPTLRRRRSLFTH